MPKRKALKVVVDVTFKAVTCPGVVLPDQASVFLHVEVLGERKRSKSLPAVFPFLFHEKMKFEKIFHQASDPVHVTNELSADVVQIELVQLSYPDGELLACYNENAREFLFPTPKISPKYPGVDREVLFCRTGTFPGIAPKLEFSSRTIIKEVNTSDSFGGKLRSTKSSTGQARRSTSSLKESISAETVEKIKPRKSRSTKRAESKPKIYPKTPIPESNSQLQSSSLIRSSISAQSNSDRRYQQSTISSRARSPSPYTRRRMAQLSVTDPFDSAIASRPFRTELEDRPDFVVRKVTPPTLDVSICRKSKFQSDNDPKIKQLPLEARKTRPLSPPPTNSTQLRHPFPPSSRPCINLDSLSRELQAQRHLKFANEPQRKSRDLVEVIDKATMTSSANNEDTDSSHTHHDFSKHLDDIIRRTDHSLNRVTSARTLNDDVNDDESAGDALRSRHSNSTVTSSDLQLIADDVRKRVRDISSCLNHADQINRQNLNIFATMTRSHSLNDVTASRSNPFPAASSIPHHVTNRVFEQSLSCGDESLSHKASSDVIKSGNSDVRKLQSSDVIKSRNCGVMKSKNSEKCLKSSEQKRVHFESNLSADGSYVKDDGRPLSAPETPLINYQRSVENSIRDDALRTSSILERKPLSDRFYSNEFSPYNEIRDRIHHLLNTPLGGFKGRSYEAVNRERRRATSYTSRLSPPRVDDVTASSFEQRIDQAYQDMYKSLNSN